MNQVHAVAVSVRTTLWPYIRRREEPCRKARPDLVLAKAVAMANDLRREVGSIKAGNVVVEALDDKGGIVHSYVLNDLYEVVHQCEGVLPYG